MQTPRITYFDIRGRIEPVRLIFEELGIAYEDRRITAIDEWQALRPTMPFGQLPIYEDSKRTIVQSQAILRHVARTHDLYGAGEAGRVQCDIVEEAITEIREAVWRFQWQHDHAQQAQQFREVTLTPALDALQRWRRRSGHLPHWVGSSLTYVDFLAFAFLDELRAFFAETVAPFAELRACRDAVAARPRVAAYLASDRRPAAFGYALHGLKYDPEMQRHPPSSSSSQ